MDFTLTLDKILELPNDILKTSEKYDEYSELLRKKVYDDYDFKELREKIEKKFDKFKDMKYLYNFPVESSIRITPTYQVKEGSTSNSPISKVEQAIVKKVDSQLWMNCFYDSLMKVAAKLTLQEASYLVDSFFSHKSEDIIAEKLGICKMTLQNIKKSCLIKLWIELRTLDEEDE